jgi:orotidine-5'-phosphate decarboxylase
MKEKIVIALDTSSRERALELVHELQPLTGMFKVGSQLYMAAGPAIIADVLRTGGRVFLDLKFHDIPNTVTRAAVDAAGLGISMMTIHASGGRRMVESTVNELEQRFGTKRPLVMAVTVLTSFDAVMLQEIGVERPLNEQVQRLALLAQSSGADGAVCSPHEIGYLRKILNPQFKLLTPGIRLPDQPVNDQQRVATAREAIAAGADYIVLGRAVTESNDPKAALQHMLL